VVTCVSPVRFHRAIYWNSTSGMVSKSGNVERWRSASDNQL